MHQKKTVEENIKQFHSYALNLPVELNQKLVHMISQLKNMSEQTYVQERNQAVSGERIGEGYEPHRFLQQLYELYLQMDAIARQQEENQFELLQAVNVIRGELGMATELPEDKK